MINDWRQHIGNMFAACCFNILHRLISTNHPHEYFVLLLRQAAMGIDGMVSDHLGSCPCLHSEAVHAATVSDKARP